MSEEIIGALAKLEGLKVISRTSAFFFKGKDVNLRTIGQELNVEHVLEGSVRKAGNRIRISAQLIKVTDDTHLWADTYDRELEDVFAIQDEISHAVVENLKVKLLNKISEPLVKDYRKNTDAYELFLKGKYFENKGDFLEWKKAIEFFERAIKADPEFAPAYSNLAGLYTAQANQISLPSNEMWSEVKSLTLKALEIDEMDPYTHLAIGRIKSFYEYDWQGAEISIERAIKLNPSNSDAYMDYGLYLIAVGHVNEAVEKMKRAVELDPVSIHTNTLLGCAFYFAEDIDKAIDQLQKTLELSPTASLPLELLAGCYGEKGMYDEAFSILQKLEDITAVQSILARIYSYSGKKKEAQKILDEFLGKSEKEYFSAFSIASVYESLDEKDKVFEWLEKSVEERNASNMFLKAMPAFDGLHSDPRWTELMKKMNLAD
jgi:tetratricopeptide (TPR) repeat protein